MRIFLQILLSTLSFTACLSCIEKERAALLSFKNGFVSNNNNTFLPTWRPRAGDDCCSWEGVKCNPNTSLIISLALDNCLLGAHAFNFSSFHNLVSLQSLDLFGNGLTMFDPTLGSLCNLKMLDLGYNEFSSIQEVFDGLSSGCTRASLQRLDLGDNNLKGSLPDVSTFPMLKSLHLNDNLLQGLSFDSFGPNSKLSVLDLTQNKLTGALPESVGQMSSLRALMVSSNNLVGVISPAHFFNLSNLQILDLSDNSFSFDLSSDFLFPTQLVSIQLRSCKLGPKFPNWLKGQTNFSYLDISNSGISDFIPTWFWNFSSNLMFLNLSSNGFNEEIPNRKYIFRYPPAVDLSSNMFYGPPPKFLSNTTVLNLSKNKFFGNLSFLCSIKNNAMTYLDLSDNLLYGNLPYCWRDFGMLNILRLGGNNLSGTIPNSIGFLVQVQHLSLRNNGLSGELPRSLGKCLQLSVLDLGENKLSGFIPPWIGDDLGNLFILSLMSNDFHGGLPQKLCNIEWLQILDLSMNNLSGAIPSCLHKLTSMTKTEPESRTHPSLRFFYTYFTILADDNGAYEVQVGSPYISHAYVTWKGREREYSKTVMLLKAIDLSSNKLTGDIPGNLTGLLGLNGLNLSRNMLTGSIPRDIGQLKLLEALDLSANQVSGQVPYSMVELSYLSVLDLSNNNLSGRIPSSTQLQSFGPLAYHDNLHLCGPPLDTCSWEKSVDTSSRRKSFEEDEGWFETLWFYSGLGFGILFGYVGVPTLLLNKSLRRIYLSC